MNESAARKPKIGLTDAVRDAIAVRDKQALAVLVPYAIHVAVHGPGRGAVPELEAEVARVAAVPCAPDDVVAEVVGSLRLFLEAEPGARDAQWWRVRCAVDRYSQLRAASAVEAWRPAHALAQDEWDAVRDARREKR